MQEIGYINPQENLKNWCFLWYFLQICFAKKFIRKLVISYDFYHKFEIYTKNIKSAGNLIRNSHRKNLQEKSAGNRLIFSSGNLWQNYYVIGSIHDSLIYFFNKIKDRLKFVNFVQLSFKYHILLSLFYYFHNNNNNNNNNNYHNQLIGWFSKILLNELWMD